MRTIIGVDIGTSFIRVAVGEVVEDNSVRIIGTSCEKSEGLNRGKIVNIVAASNAIRHAIESAEQMAGVQISSCFVSSGGNQIDCQQGVGKVAILEKTKGRREIDQSDIDRAIECATAVNITMDREKLHVAIQEFRLDNTSYVIKEPLHSLAYSLDVSVLIITASRTSIRNINACLNSAGYDVAGVILKTFAAQVAVTTKEERELGSVIIDLGAGTTDILVLYKDAPAYIASIPLGGIDVTNDIAIVLGIPFDEAEKIKIDFGCCWVENVDQNSTVIVNGVGGRPPEEVPNSKVSKIIQDRMAEILKMVGNKISANTGFGELAGNIILIGGGACLDGVIELTQSVFGTSAVRIGTPDGFGDLNQECESPEWSTAFGLVAYSKDKGHENKESKKQLSSKPRSGNIFSKIIRALF